MVIKTVNNEPVQISNCDANRVLQHKWHTDYKNKGYIYTNIKGEKIYLHRFVTNCPAGYVVDHINHFVSDNRQENLRVCDCSLNARNQRILAKNQTGFRNVYKYGKKKYRLQTRLDGKTTTLYVGDTIQECLYKKIELWLDLFGLDIKQEVYKATMQKFGVSQDVQEIIMEVM